MARLEKALATKQALEAEAARSVDPARRASLRAQAQAGWDEVKRQCELEMESLNQQIAVARDFETIRGPAGLQSVALIAAARHGEEKSREWI